MHHIIPSVVSYVWIGLSITILLFLVEKVDGKRKAYSDFHNAVYFLILWIFWPIPLVIFLFKKEEKND